VIYRCLQNVRQEFEFAPNVATSSQEVSKKELSIINNEDPDIISVSQSPGMLSLFNGKKNSSPYSSSGK
jgi:hypothetical protein